jgi:hypothetical protein
MKLFKDAAAKLERAQQDLVATEAAILAAQAEHLEKSEAPAEELEAIDLRIDGLVRRLRIYEQQCARYRDQVAEADRAAAAERRAQAIKQAETTVLPARMAALEALAAWARGGVPLVATLQAATRLKDWPAHLERPFLHLVRDEQFLRAIARALSGLGPDWNPAEAIAIVDDAVALQKENHAEAIAELRAQPAAQSEEIAA